MTMTGINKLRSIPKPLSHIVKGWAGPGLAFARRVIGSVVTSEQYGTWLSLRYSLFVIVFTAFSHTYLPGQNAFRRMHDTDTSRVHYGRKRSWCWTTTSKVGLTTAMAMTVTSIAELRRSPRRQRQIVKGRVRSGLAFARLRVIQSVVTSEEYGTWRSFRCNPFISVFAAFSHSQVWRQDAFRRMHHIDASLVRYGRTFSWFKILHQTWE